MSTFEESPKTRPVATDWRKRFPIGSQRPAGRRDVRCPTGNFWASLAVVGASIAGLVLQSPGAGAAVVPAHAKVTVGSKTYKWSGGTCPTTVNSAQYFLSIGEGTGGLEMIGKVSGGKFTNMKIALVKGSYSTADSKDSGTITAKGGTFKGVDVYGKKMKGSFTC